MQELPKPSKFSYGTLCIILRSSAWSLETEEKNFNSTLGPNTKVLICINCLILQKTFPVLQRTNSWAYWPVLYCDLEEEAVEQITKGKLSTFKFIYYSTDCGCEQICVCISISHPLVESPNPLVTTWAAECICAFIWMLELMNKENCNSGNQSFVELQSAFVCSFEC
jgi:hypothetical protein